MAIRRDRRLPRELCPSTALEVTSLDPATTPPPLPRQTQKVSARLWGKAGWRTGRLGSRQVPRCASVHLHDQDLGLRPQCLPLRVCRGGLRRIQPDHGMGHLFLCRAHLGLTPSTWCVLPSSAPVDSSTTMGASSSPFSAFVGAHHHSANYVLLHCP